jgi:serine/threonine protein kinase
MTPASLEGQTLGKYRLLEPLGRGGMAQVYRAYHPTLDRYVAIKVLRSDLVEEEEFLARFRREAHAVSGLRHTNIVQVFDFDIQDDYYFMVMELLEGDSLRACLNAYRVKNERIPLTDVARILSDVLNGLAHAHGEGIVHRDIKPANILLTKRGQAVITDFGIAQIVGTTQYTVTGALMGTLNYMAPEQGLRNQCDQRSDIYSLGIVLYEMLTGFTPFDADTPLAILMKHLHDPLPLPSQLDPALPAAFETIVLKALAKNPEERYQSAEDMLAALKAVSDSGLPDGARPISPLRAAYSGDQRRAITDLNFANADTDADILKSVTPAPIQATPDPTSTKPASSFLERVTLRPLNVITAIFGTGVVILITNMFAVMFSINGRDVFERGWPFQIMFAAMFLFALGWAVSTHWIMIPGLITLGTALLLAYSTITGRWGDWAFLWMLETLFVFAAITFAIQIGRKSQAAQIFWARTGNAALMATAFALVLITCAYALILR